MYFTFTKLLIDLPAWFGTIALVNLLFGITDTLYGAIESNKFDKAAFLP